MWNGLHQSLSRVITMVSASNHRLVDDILSLRTWFDTEYKPAMCSFFQKGYCIFREDGCLIQRVLMI